MKTKKNIKDRAAVYVDSEALAIVQDFCIKTGETYSGLVDGYTQQLAKYLRMIGAERKKSFTRVDLLRLAIVGMGELGGAFKDSARKPNGHKVSPNEVQLDLVMEGGN